MRETYLYERENNLKNGWESISRIIYIKRSFSSKKKEHITESFYVTDLKTDNAEYMAKGIRKHWHIENKLHYVKDVIMREDKESTRNKKAAANLGLLRDCAFNILKDIDKSIKRACEVFENYTIGKIMRILERS